MVYFRQEGTIYDVPLDVLWEFLDWEGHGQAHEKSGRNFAILDRTPRGTLVTYETFRGGEWRKVTAWSLDIPPLGRFVEEVEGLYAGTQLVFLYTPMGRRTRLDIVARFVSADLDAEALERQMADSIDAAGVEDEPYLERFARSRTRP